MPTSTRPPNSPSPPPARGTAPVPGECAGAIVEVRLTALNNIRWNHAADRGDEEEKAETGGGGGGRRRGEGPQRHLHPGNVGISTHHSTVHDHSHRIHSHRTSAEQGRRAVIRNPDKHAEADSETRKTTAAGCGKAGGDACGHWQRRWGNYTKCADANQGGTASSDEALGTAACTDGGIGGTPSADASRRDGATVGIAKGGAASPNAALRGGASADAALREAGSIDSAVSGATSNDAALCELASSCGAKGGAACPDAALRDTASTEAGLRNAASVDGALDGAQGITTILHHAQGIEGGARRRSCGNTTDDHPHFHFHLIRSRKVGVRETRFRPSTLPILAPADLHCDSRPYANARCAYDGRGRHLRIDPDSADVGHSERSWAYFHDGRRHQVHQRVHPTGGGVRERQAVGYPHTAAGSVSAQGSAGGWDYPDSASSTGYREAVEWDEAAAWRCAARDGEPVTDDGQGHASRRKAQGDEARRVGRGGR